MQRIKEIDKLNKKKGFQKQIFGIILLQFLNLKQCFGNILNMMKTCIGGNKKENWQFDTFTHFQKFLAIQETEVTICRQTIT